MAYTFLKAKGFEIGNSLLENDYIEYCKNLLSKTDKIILPIDHVVSKSIEVNESTIKKELEKD